MIFDKLYNTLMEGLMDDFGFDMNTFIKKNSDNLSRDRDSYMAKQEADRQAAEGKRQAFAQKLADPTSYSSNRNFTQQLKNDYRNQINALKAQYKDVQHSDEDFEMYRDRRNMLVKAITSTSESLLRKDAEQRNIEASGTPSDEWYKGEDQLGSATSLQNDLEKIYDDLIELETAYASGDTRLLRRICLGKTSL